MSTKEIKKVMHELKLRLLTVKSVEDLSPHMRRITLTGPELEGFVTMSPEDHVKVFFPKTNDELPVLPTMTDKGPVFTDDVTMRDYTPRFNNGDKELVLDFALHKKGPASLWASRAQTGNTLGIGGPRASTIYPEFKNYILIGDDTAIPSIGRRLSELPKNGRAIAILEVDDESAELVFETEADVEVLWLYRDGEKAGDSKLFAKQIKALNLPTEDVLTIISGEISVVKELKRVFIEDYHFDETWIKATGYWRA
ncbi:siderophore-interacting protein [Bacteriovorax sp. PP10]|uniref:Siderophore-interacting protein n=1 Tax=Bacteriovorax antarcticus TaxID=3088717 RepID=A0ABU5VSL6_9BACT|nr:siderophore-interacting protein [Bacteriovorax sp. PP10]MEA9356044.1 siderophore-interacting protein [Bacteriovorax sp. PP10]